MRKSTYNLAKLEDSIVNAEHTKAGDTMNPLHSEVLVTNSNINANEDAEETQYTEDDSRIAWKNGPSKYVVMLAFIAALNSCNLGFDQGVNAGVASSMQRGDPNTLYLSDYRLEVFMGIMSAAALVGACSMFYFADKYGRRNVFLSSSLIFILGVSLMALAPDYGTLLVGRVITGFGIGLGLAIGPMYVSEVSPPKFRGQLVSWNEFAINLGILLGFIASFALKDVSGNLQWRLMIGLGILMPMVLLFLVMFKMPESPRWLVYMGRRDEAIEIIMLCDPAVPDASEVLKDIEAEVRNEIEGSQNITWSQIFSTDGVYFKMMRAGIGIAIAQQITAEEPLLYYMLDILESAGISDVTEQFVALILIGVAKVAVIITTGYLFDVYGRKTLLCWSNVGIGISLLTMAAVSDHLPGLAFAALVFYVVSFSAGMGPGCWLTISEIFPSEIRARAVSVCTVCNRLTALILTITFLSFKNNAGSAACYGVFMMFAVTNVLFVMKYLPETKGVQLEQISRLFHQELKIWPRS